MEKYETLAKLISNATQGEDMQKVFTITEQSIVSRMIWEYLSPHGAWCKYGMEGFWQVWQAIETILNMNDVPGGDVESDMLNAINATVKTEECKEIIIPWVNESRLHYTMNETSTTTKTQKQ